MAIVRDPQALQHVRRSGSILAAALDQVAASVRPGITTLALDQVAEAAVRGLGGEPAFLGYRGFPRTLCVSVNDEVVHGIPRSDQRLQSGDLVGLDLGVRFEGWYTDAALTVGVGEIVAEARQLQTAAAEALQRGLAVVRRGATTGDIGAAVQAFVEAQGFSVVRDLVGHGIGRNLHEDPSIPNVGKAGHGSVLRDGMLIAIEPMITAGKYHVQVDDDGWTIRTRDGSLAAHFEQTVLVTADGFSLLTPYGAHSWR